MELQTVKEIITLKLEPGETLQVIFHPDGYNEPREHKEILKGITIGTRFLKNGRMVLTLFPHDNCLFREDNQLVLLDDKNEPKEVVLDWQYGIMNLKRLSDD